MLLIDKYAYTNRLTNFNPFYKFAIVVISLGVTTITKYIYVNLFILCFMVFCATVVAGIPADKYLRILFIPFSFFFIGIIPILFGISKIDIFIWSFNVFDSYIGINEGSIDVLLLLTARVFAAIASTFFLSLTTPLNDLIKVFKRIHLPGFIIELIVLTYRFIFIFIEEAKDIHLAQEMRFGYISFMNSLKSVSLLIRSLFLKVLLDYKEMSVVLECKLYDGKFRTGD